jgi:hypothetical protein
MHVARLSKKRRPARRTFLSLVMMSACAYDWSSGRAPGAPTSDASPDAEVSDAALPVDSSDDSATDVVDAVQEDDPRYACFLLATEIVQWRSKAKECGSALTCTHYVDDECGCMTAVFDRASDASSQFSSRVMQYRDAKCDRPSGCPSTCPLLSQPSVCTNQSAGPNVCKP